MRQKKVNCHEECDQHAQHSISVTDHHMSLSRLKKIKGQLGGLEKMIEDQRYCVDILVQFRAVIAALSAIEKSVFERHITGCVNEAILSKDKIVIKEKVEELTKLISKRLY